MVLLSDSTGASSYEWPTIVMHPCNPLQRNYDDKAVSGDEHVDVEILSELEAGDNQTAKKLRRDSTEEMTQYMEENFSVASLYGVSGHLRWAMIIAPIRRSHSLDEPKMFAKDNRAAPLRGLKWVQDVHAYQYRRDGICMLVLEQYSCEAYYQAIHDRFVEVPIPMRHELVPFDATPWFYYLDQDGPLVESNLKYIKNFSDTLLAAISMIGKSKELKMKEWDQSSLIFPPYNHFYHRHGDMVRLSKQLLPFEKQKLVSVMLDYIKSSQRESLMEVRGKEFRLPITILEEVPRVCDRRT